MVSQSESAVFLTGTLVDGTQIEVDTYDNFKKNHKELFQEDKPTRNTQQQNMFINPSSPAQSNGTDPFSDSFDQNTNKGQGGNTNQKMQEIEAMLKTSAVKMKEGTISAYNTMSDKLGVYVKDVKNSGAWGKIMSAFRQTPQPTTQTEPTAPEQEPVAPSEPQHVPIASNNLKKKPLPTIPQKKALPQVPQHIEEKKEEEQPVQEEKKEEENPAPLLDIDQTDNKPEQKQGDLLIL